MKNINLSCDKGFYGGGISVMTIVFILVLGSCADSLIEKEDRNVEVFKNPTFSISENVATYTSLGSTLNILWQEGDQIGIFCPDTDPPTANERAILLQPYVGQNRGVFRSDINWGTQSHKFYVYYPWKEDVGLAPELRHSIQRIQTQNGGNSSMHIGKNAFMFARSNAVVPSSGDIALNFTHTTCIFEISFKSDFPEVFGKPLTKVVLKADNGVTLAGDFTLDITDSYSLGNMPEFIDESKSDSVILDVKNAYMPSNATDSLKVYLVTNPADLNSGGVVIKYTVDGIEYTLTKEVNRPLQAQKVYKIMTKVDYSDLTVTPSLIYLSPAHPTQTVTVQSTHPWESDDAGVALFDGIGEQRGTSAVFKRKFSPTNFNVYGNGYATIKTIGENPKYATIRIANLFLSVPEELYIGNPVGADTTVYIPDIVAFGGSANFIVDDYTGDWIQSIVYDELSGKLKARVLHNSTNSDRPGTLTIHHADDPDYKIEVQLLQNEFVYVPEFKFFVMDVQWCKRSSLDVDIAFLFEGNNPVTPFEHIPVGWGSLSNEPLLSTGRPSNWKELTGNVTSSITYVNYETFSGQTVKLLNWGGDATQGQGETVYFDAEAFHNAVNVPRYLNLGLYLVWYNHGVDEDWTVRVTLSCYKGGVMTKYSSIPNQYETNYRNDGGTLVHSQSFFIDLIHISRGNVASTFKTSFTYAAAITYDRLTHYGIMRETNPSVPKWSADRALCKNGFDVNSTPISQEEMERIENAKKKVASQIF